MYQTPMYDAIFRRNSYAPSPSFTPAFPLLSPFFLRAAPTTTVGLVPFPALAFFRHRGRFGDI